MTLVVVEGYDGGGKTETINKIVEKYGANKIDTMVFPTPAYRNIIGLFKKTENLANTPQNLYFLHSMFEIDFANQYDKMIQMAAQKKLCLCDRYFISNIVYFRYNVHTYYDTNQIQKNSGLWIQDFEKLLRMNGSHVKPDMVIHLEAESYIMKKDSDKTLDEEIKKQDLVNVVYDQVLDSLKNDRYIFDYAAVPALRPDTIENVEKILIDNGWL